MRLPWRRALFERTAWLADDVLLAIGWCVEPGKRLVARLVTASGTRELEARWVAYPRPDLDTPAGGGRVAVIGFPSALDRHQAGTLAFESAGVKWSLAVRALPASTTSLREVVGCGIGWLDPTTRSSILAFLTENVDLHGDSSAQLAESLALLRDVLRTPLPERPIDPTQPCAARLELVLRVDDCSFYLRGWAHTATSVPARLTVISPEGCRAEVLHTAFRFQRPDVNDLYKDAVGRVGFVTFVQLPRPSLVSQGWLIELVGRDGIACQSPACSVIAGPRASLCEKLLSDLDLDRHLRNGLVERHIAPAIRRLQELDDVSSALGDERRFGTPPRSPEVSIIVPLYKRLDLLEQQLAQFALDPEFDTVELIYVLDSPELADTLQDLARQLHDLYHVSFRVLFLPRNVGYATANNAAVSRASGRLLLLLNSDVFPTDPGWVGRMRAYHDATPRIGALGVKLLYEDDTLQHAGLYFQRDPNTTVWQNLHYFKGLAPTFAPATVARKVPGVTGACLMIARALYLEQGGLSGAYIQGDYEDSDLCLRLLAAGYDNWYFPDVELYHLEGQSYGWTGRMHLSRYNAWMHTRLWNDVIEQVMARFAS